MLLSKLRRSGLCSRLGAVMRASSFLVVEKLARLSIGLFVNVKIAELMGLEIFGQYSMIIAFAAFCLSASFIGFDNRLLTSKPSDITIPRILSYGIIRAALFFICALFIFLYSDANISQYTVYLPFLSIAAMMVLAEQVSVLFKQFQLFVCIRLTVYVLLILPLRVIGLSNQETLFFFVGLAIMDLFLPALIYSFYFFMQISKRENFYFSHLVDGLVGTMKGIISSDFRYFVIGVILVLAFRLDYLVGAQLISSQELGRYAFAMMFITPFTSFGKTFTYALRSSFPDLANSAPAMLMILLVIPIAFSAVVTGFAALYIEQIKDLIPLFRVDMLWAVFVVPIAWYALFSNQQMSSTGLYAHLFAKSFFSLLICYFYYASTKSAHTFLYLVGGLYLFYLIQGICYDVFIMNRMFIK